MNNVQYVSFETTSSVSVILSIIKQLSEVKEVHIVEKKTTITERKPKALS